ncbi:MAG: alpha/beta fold hydrolase [Thermoleophilia bacterium]|nr:alpha/beta fold hydrolase [Thermoleophilia bacterium]
MPRAGVAGTELYYERAGAGEPLLLIQGMSGTRLSWGEPFLAPLRQSFDCISFDNRGIGLSAPVTDPFAIADLAADSLALLDALEVERAHVLGISMGGMVAQELALAEPERVRSLALGCTYCGGPGSQLMDPAEFAPLAEAFASRDRDRVLRASWEVNLSPGFRADESRFAEFAEMAAAAPVSQAILGLQLQAIYAHDTNARLPGLEIPTLVVHGTVDSVLPVANGRQIASLIRDSRLEIFDEVGHMFWWEQPERSAELVREHALAAA